MRTAILGAGNVGRALAERLLAAGFEVRFGAREPSVTASRLTGVLADVPVLAPDEAASGAELLFVAVPAEAAVESVRSAGEVGGCCLVDCTNPLRWDEGPHWAPPAEGSVAEQLAAAFPEASVVKGFNHFGAEIHRDPDLSGRPADAFFAADDESAKARAMDLASRLGFQPVDAGPLRNASLLENMAVLWIHLAIVAGRGRDFSFVVEP